MSNDDNPFASGDAGSDGYEEFDDTSLLDPVPLDVGPILQRCFDLFKANPAVIISAILVVFAVSFVFGLIDAGFDFTAELMREDQPEASILLQVVGVGVSLVSSLISVFLQLGMVRIFLNITRGQDAALGQLFSGGRYFLTAVLAQIVMVIVMMLGILACIVPGIILALGLQFFTYTIVDKNLGPIEALKESWRLTDGHKMTLFLVGFVIGIMGVVLFCCTLGIGYLLALPILSLTQAVMYQSLLHYDEELNG